MKEQEFKQFIVMHSGRFYLPELELILEEADCDDKEEIWAEVYRVISRPSTWLVYYGEHVLGYSYVRFVHSTDEALLVVKNWFEFHEV